MLYCITIEYYNTIILLFYYIIKYYIFIINSVILHSLYNYILLNNTIKLHAHK